MDCPPRQNKVAVVERWPLAEVRLQNFECITTLATPVLYFMWLRGQHSWKSYI